MRAIYQQHGAPAMALAFRILGDPAEAEDVVQETFVEVWRRSAEYSQDRGGERAWVCAITRSRAIDRLRARKSGRRAVERAALEPLVREEPPSEYVGERERIVRCMATLSAGQREAIELAYFAGLTQQEIADRTSVPLGTVKTRIRIGIQRLAELLTER